MILLVEDDVDNQTYMRVLMRDRYEMLVASSGEELRGLLNSYGGVIDLILMDLSLRGNENGLVLTAGLRTTERFRTTPIVAVTAHVTPEDRTRALAAGCDDFLSKPFDRELLFAVVERTIGLGGKAGGDQHSGPTEHKTEVG